MIEEKVGDSDEREVAEYYKSGELVVDGRKRENQVETAMEKVSS